MVIFKQVNAVLSKQCVDSFVKMAGDTTTVLFQNIARESKTTFSMSRCGMATFKGEWVGIVSVYNILQDNLASFQNSMPLTRDIEMIDETVPSYSEVSDGSTGRPSRSRCYANSEACNENDVQYDRTLVKTETADYTTTDHSYSKLSLFGASHMNGNTDCNVGLTDIKINPVDNLAMMNLDSEQPLRIDDVFENSTETGNNGEMEIPRPSDISFIKEPENLDGIIVYSVTSSLDILNTNACLNNSVFINSSTFPDNISSVKTELEILDNNTINPNFAIDKECIDMKDANTLVEEDTNNIDNIAIDPNITIDTDVMGMVDGSILNEVQDFGLYPLCAKTRVRKRRQKRFDDFDYSDMLGDDVTEDNQRIRKHGITGELVSSKTGNHRTQLNSDGSSHVEGVINNEHNSSPTKKRGRPRLSKKSADKVEHKIKDSELRQQFLVHDSIRESANSPGRNMVSAGLSTKTEVNHARKSGKGLVSNKLQKSKWKVNAIGLLLKCQHCKYTTYKSELLSFHLRRMHLNEEHKEFQCQYCDKKFGVRSDFNHHVNRVHTTERFPCDKCGTSCKTKRGFKLHKAKHEALKNTGNESTIIKRGRRPQIPNTTLLNCTMCNFTSEKASKFREHQQRVHLDDDLKKFKCHHCFKLFGLRRDFKCHIRKVHKLFSCSHCSETYKSKEGVALHESKHDPNYVAPTRPQCPECNKTFCSKFSRDNHIQLIHRGKKGLNKKYLCNICGKILIGINSYTSHQNVHSGERPYACIVCGRAFRDARSLKLHGVIHEDVCNYKCKFCDKAFKHNNGLRMHELTHTKVQNFKCHSCGRAFTQSTSLARHLLTHTGAKPFHCNACASVFRDKSTARRHVILVHKVKSNWQDYVSEKADSPSSSGL